MKLKRWEELPEKMQNTEVQKYYDILWARKKSLITKRLFDVFGSGLLILALLPIMVVIGLVIKIDSKGKIIYKQKRITQYGYEFKIYKFRTMVENAEKLGTLVTQKQDSRITRAGKILRKYRLDELPQVFNILVGDMTFVGTRPEVFKYVKEYDDEMLATLLLPAGVTSETSVLFKEEEQLLDGKDNVDSVYINEVLPLKMIHNLEYLKEFSFTKDIKVMLMTVKEVFF